MRSMRQMNEMMNSMFANPFGMFGMGPPALAPSTDRARNELMPFSFPNMNMNRMFEGFVSNVILLVLLCVCIYIYELW